METGIERHWREENEKRLDRLRAELIILKQKVATIEAELWPYNAYLAGQAQMNDTRGWAGPFVSVMGSPYGYMRV